MRIKSILFVTYKLSDGGAERAISRFASELSELGYRIGLLIFKRQEDEYLVSSGVKIFSFSNKYSEDVGNVITRTLRRKKEIHQVLKQFMPDCVIPFLEPIVRETYFASRGLGIPIVATLRDTPQVTSFLKRILRTYVYNKSNAIFLQSKAQVQYVAKKNRKKCFIVPNPVSDDFIEAMKNRSYRTQIRRIVSVGRLAEQKNYPLLIRSIEKTHRNYPELKLIIYGEGECKDLLRDIIDSLNAEEYIILKGRTNDLAQELLNSDLFIMTSNHEGMPNALMEAMATGIPCISSDCPTGPKELLGKNERGILFEKGSEKELEDAISFCINNPEKANSLGKQAALYIANYYSVKDIANRLVNELSKVI